MGSRGLLRGSGLAPSLVRKRSLQVSSHLLGAGVEREGLLMKRGSVIQSNWKKRYFVLAGEGLLCWHASEATARALSDALRGAAMEEATGRRMRSDSNAGCRAR